MQHITHMLSICSHPTPDCAKHSSFAQSGVWFWSKTVCVRACACVSVLCFSEKQQVQCRTRKGSPVIWSEGMTVGVAAINEETRPLNHILSYHTQTVQYVAQLTKRNGNGKLILILAKENNPILCHVGEYMVQCLFYTMCHISGMVGTADSFVHEHFICCCTLLYCIIVNLEKKLSHCPAG